MSEERGAVIQEADEAESRACLDVPAGPQLETVVSGKLRQGQDAIQLVAASSLADGSMRLKRVRRNWGWGVSLHRLALSEPCT